MSADETESMNEIVLKVLEDAIDSGKNLNETKTKKELFTSIRDAHTDWNEASIKSAISRQKVKVAKLRGIKPSELGVGSKKPLYDDALDLSVDKSGAVDSDGLKSTNPLIAKKLGKDGKPIIKNSESPLTEEAFGSVGALGYDLIALTDSDMEDLTEQERKDFANVLKPIADKYFAGEKATVIFAVGAMFGLILKKKRKAIKVRHERELKSGKKEKTPNENPIKEIKNNETEVMKSEGAKQD